jgi:hypothetical protein
MLFVHVFTSHEHSVWMIGSFHTPGLSNDPRFLIAWTYDSVYPPIHFMSYETNNVDGIVGFPADLPYLVLIT